MLYPIVLLALPVLSNAQYSNSNGYQRHRGLSRGGIGGIIVAALAAILFCVMLGICMRRRKRRSQQSSLPIFNQGQPQQPMSHSQGPQPWNQNLPTEPPKSHMMGGGIAPPGYGSGNMNYAPPPGPPPAAHTAPQNGQFVGGFKQ